MSASPNRTIKIKDKSISTLIHEEDSDEDDEDHHHHH